MELFRVQDELTGSNCYIIVEGEKAFVIDPNHREKVPEELKKRKLVPVAVALTHEHCDHIQGLSAIREKWPVTVIASKRCSRGIQSQKENMSSMMEVYLYFKSGQKQLFHYEPFVCEPADITFESELELEFEKHRLRLASAPGHTHGSVCIFLDEEILFSGDYFLPGEPVITRLPGGSEQEYEERGKPFLAGLRAGYRVMPGHGDGFILTEEVKKVYGL